MKRTLILCVLLSLALPLAAVDGDQVMYVGGTVSQMKAGDVGRLDLRSADMLSFEHSGDKLTIPYADIESFRYTNPVAHHLGLMPAIAVALMRAPRHRHFFRIVYRSPGRVAQAVILEVPKGMAETLNSVLEIRIHPNCRAPIPPSLSVAKLSPGKHGVCGECPEVR